MERGEFGTPSGTGSGGPEDFLAAGGSPEEIAKYLESLRGGPVGERYDIGRSLESTLARHPNPETLLSTVRLMRIEQEDLSTGGEMPNDYVIGRIADILEDRKVATGISFEELLEEDLAQELDERTRSALNEMIARRLVPKEMAENTQYFGRAMHVGGYGMGEVAVEKEVEESYEKDGEKKKINIRYRPVTETVTYFGPDKDREDFSERCSSMRAEILVRHLIVKNWGRYNTFREALSRLVEIYFGPVPMTKGVEVLFNLRGRERGPTQTTTGVEYRKGAEFGDMVDTAMRLYLINALSEKPHLFKELMNDPMWRQFVFPTDDAMKEWVGNPAGWREDERDAKGEIILGSVRTKKMLKIENGAVFPTEKMETKEQLEEEPVGYDPNKDKRGRLTRGNIFAEKKEARDKRLDASIREFLGGGKNQPATMQQEAKAAQQLAYKLFKLWLFADEFGFEFYRDPSVGAKDPSDPLKGKDLVFENGPAASDFGKLTFPYLYLLKSYRKGRDFAPPSGFPSEYKDFFQSYCVSAFTLFSSRVRLGDGSERRSFMEQWRGLPAAKVGSKDYAPEPAKRVGELPWAQAVVPEIDEETAILLDLPLSGITEEAIQKLYLTTFMGGREAGGTYTLLTKTDFTPQELTDYGFWRKFWKVMDVGITEATVLGGRFRGVDANETTKAKAKEDLKEYKVDIVKKFIKGIQSLPQWGQWEEQEMEFYDRKAGKTRKLKIFQRILEVAEEAFKQYGVELRLLTKEQLYPKG